MLANRTEAGRQLAQRLMHYAHCPDGLVLALPRGGVPVAFEIARILRLPMSLHLVRKLGIPHHRELAMGAIAWRGVPVVNQELLYQFAVSQEDFDRVLAEEQRELERRFHRYQGDRPLPSYRDRTLIVVDDGVATGATLQAALETLKPQQPKAIVIAVPVLSAPLFARFCAQVTELIALEQPDPLHSISQWYRDFHQLTDEEVADFLQRLPAPESIVATSDFLPEIS